MGLGVSVGLGEGGGVSGCGCRLGMDGVSWGGGCRSRPLPVTAKQDPSPLLVRGGWQQKNLHHTVKQEFRRSLKTPH